MKKLILLLSVLVVLGVSGCGGPSEEEAKATFCQNLAKLGYAAMQLESLDENSAVQDVKDTVRLYNDALNDLRWSALDAKDTKIDDLEDRISDLENAIDDIEDDATVADALASVQDEWQAVVDAYNAVTADIQCNIVISVDEAAPESTEEAGS